VPERKLLKLILLERLSWLHSSVFPARVFPRILADQVHVSSQLPGDPFLIRRRLQIFSLPYFTGILPDIFQYGSINPTIWVALKAANST
jgi:hypothetical protein